MTVKYHKTNTNFQIAYFLAGACHTPDAAYFQLRELLESREAAYNDCLVNEKRREAKKIRAQNYLKSDRTDEAGRLEAEADLEEIANAEEVEKVLVDANNDEINFIKKCIDIVKPLCVYVGKDGVSDIEANELSQRDEWKFELIARAENFMLTSGTIPAGEFVTMRMHPDFKTEILPKVKELQERLLLSEGRQRFEKELSGSNFNLLEEVNKKHENS